MKKEHGILGECFPFAIMATLIILPVHPSHALDVQDITLCVTEYRRDGVLSDTPYEFTAGVNGDDITAVTMTTPGGYAISFIPGSTGQFNWTLEVGEYETLEALRTLYPLGNYVFTFNNGEDSVTLTHNPAVPTGWANITNPMDGSTDVPLDPTYTWDSCVGYGDSLNMAVGEEDVPGLISLVTSADISEISWNPPEILNPGRLYVLEVSVYAGTVAQPYSLQTANGDSFGYYDHFENCNYVLFTTVNPVDINQITFITEKEYIGGIPEANPFGLWGMVTGTNISSIQVTSPPPMNFTAVAEPRNGLWIFDLAEHYPTLEALREDFPNGPYQFVFNQAETTEDSVVVYTDPEQSLGFANITYPTSGAIGVPVNPTFMWESCSGYGDLLYVDVGDEDHDVLLYQDGLDIGETSWSPGPLVPGCLHSFLVGVQTGSTVGQSLTTDNDDALAYFDVFSWGNEVFFTVLAEPEATIAKTLAFFDASVAEGTLAGSGPGYSADGRLNALRNMLERSADLIDDGFNEEACGQLRDAYQKCDGAAYPPDFVTGPACVDLAAMIQEVIDSLGCE